MAKIFINYRRDDCIATAGRLHDRLALVFGRKNLFMDVDHIPAGVDFREHLDAQVAACDVLLVLIGPQWLAAADANGGRRLDNPDDYVRTEIAAALARGIRVIPVLVDGARMPAPADLPEALKPLSLRNAVEVRNTQFGSDVQRLTEKVREAGRRGRGGSRVWLSIGAAALVFLAAVFISLPLWRQRPPDRAALAPPAGQAAVLETKAKAPSVAAGDQRDVTQLSRIRLRQAVLVRASEVDWKWIEKDPRDNREVTFNFRQHATAPNELLLYDQSRDMYARLNFADRRAYWRIGQEGPWNWNYDIIATE